MAPDQDTSARDSAPGERSVAEDLAIYVDFNAFLRTAIYEFYRGGGRRNKGRFIALLIASGELATVAASAVKSEGNLRRLAIGAAGVLALRIGLRYALSGPLGILLAAGAAASLVAYFVRNRGQIVDRIADYRELVSRLNGEYEQIQSDFRDTRLTSEQRSLMIDGLLKRFLADLER